MKILYFNYLYDRLGMSLGSTRKAELLLAELRELGYDIRIYWRLPLLSEIEADSFSSRLRSPLKKRLSKWLHEPQQFLRNIKFLIEDLRILHRERPDLLIVRSDLLIFSGLLLGRLFRIPVLAEADAPCAYEAHTFHKEYLSFFGLAEWIEKTTLRQADRAICVSNAAKSHFCRMGVSPEHIRVVPNGAEPEKFLKRSGPRIDLPDSEEGPVIGFVGTFHNWHGVDILIRLIQETLRRHPKCRFLLVGRGGQMKHKLDAFVASLENPEHIIMPGYIPYTEMPVMIQSMDIVIAPYPDMELFYFSPVKIFEYMAAGKAVISTRIGQIAEVIEHGKTGMLCAPGDETALADALDSLIRDKATREELGQNAARAIQEGHTWKHRALDWAQEIDRLTESRKQIPH